VQNRQKLFDRLNLLLLLQKQANNERDVLNKSAQRAGEQSSSISSIYNTKYIDFYLHEGLSPESSNMRQVNILLPKNKQLN
jgi:hypothetical protein